MRAPAVAWCATMTSTMDVVVISAVTTPDAGGHHGQATRSDGAGHAGARFFGAYDRGLRGGGAWAGEVLPQSAGYIERRGDPPLPHLRHRGASAVREQSPADSLRLEVLLR